MHSSTVSHKFLFSFNSILPVTVILILCIGFRLLKNMLGDSAFHGQGHPNCFITDGKDTEWRALKAIWPESSVYLSIFQILQQTWQWLCDASHGIKKEQRPRLMMIAKELFYADTHCRFQYHWSAFFQSAENHQFPNFARYASCIFLIRFLDFRSCSKVIMSSTLMMYILYNCLL